LTLLSFPLTLFLFVYTSLCTHVLPQLLYKIGINMLDLLWCPIEIKGEYNLKIVLAYGIVFVY